MLNKGGHLFTTGNTSGEGGAYQLAPAAKFSTKILYLT